MDELKQFGIIPVHFDTLMSVLCKYKSPKDKVLRLIKNGSIIRIKKGMFVVSSKIHNLPLSTELIANHLYSPSYVSFESALSFYGIIPERVYSIKSATLKRRKSFSNQLENFEYIQMDSSYFSIGLRNEIVNSNYAFMIASPEKALCDLILVTKGLRLQSTKAVNTFLEEDIRADFTLLEKMNWNIVMQSAEATTKRKKELMYLCKLLLK